MNVSFGVIDFARVMAPYVILACCILALCFGHLDASGSQLLATIVGVCGAAIVPRRADATTTTLTASDPPTVTTGPQS